MPTTLKEQSDKHRPLSEWTDMLLEKELPIFSSTAQKITEVIESQKAGAMELASTILQDPTLTARTLQMANSTYYNPSNQKLGTITRAIVILGSQTVHNLSITCAFIDSVLEVKEQTRVNEELAIAIHAAVQAKQLAILTKDHSPEEIFIAALLKNLGAISFWCSGDDSTKKLDKLLSTGEIPPQKAESEVLGFHLNRLGASLSQKWQLSDLIKQTISDDYADNERAQLVQQGHRLAILLKSEGNKEELEKSLHEISESTKTPLTSLRNIIKENSKNAANIAKQFGAHQAAALIQPSLSIQKPGTSTPRTEQEPEPATNSPVKVDNHEIQLQILQEIGSMLEGDIEINQLFEMVMEGVHRGTGMDRTLFTLLSRDRDSLKEKTALGWIDRAKHKHFCFSLTGEENDLFKQSLKQPAPSWISLDSTPNLRRLFTPEIKEQIQTNDCFIAPIKVNKRIIGLLYADRATSSRDLTQEDFNSFCQFSRQANIGLTLSQAR